MVTPLITVLVQLAKAAPALPRAISPATGITAISVAALRKAFIFYPMLLKNLKAQHIIIYAGLDITHITF
jgi:hypothetical protein